MTTDHEGDEVFEQLQAEHHGLVKALAANLDLDAGVKDALVRRVELTWHAGVARYLPAGERETLGRVDALILAELRRARREVAS